MSATARRVAHRGEAEAETDGDAASAVRPFSSSKSFKEDILTLLEYIFEKTSTHGAIWYSSVNGRGTRRLRPLFLVCIALLQILVFFVFISMFWKKADDVTSMTFRQVKGALAYPKITFCNPRPFHRERARAENLTSSMASALLLYASPIQNLYLLDADAINMGEGGEGQATLDGSLALAAASAELRAEFGGDDWEVLDRISSTLVRCEEIISACYFRGGRLNSTECCSMTQAKMGMTPEGVCVTMHSVINLKVLATNADVITIVLDLDPAKTLDLDPALMPTRSLRLGATFALHDTDAAVSAIQDRPNRIRAGQSTVVTIRRHILNRGTLRDQQWNHGGPSVCVLPQDPIARLLTEDFGFDNYSQRNCRTVFTSLTFRACSIMSTFGHHNQRRQWSDNETAAEEEQEENRKDRDLRNWKVDLEMLKNLGGQRPCLPWNALEFEQDWQDLWNLMNEYCAHECEESVVTLEASSSNNADGGDGGAREVAVVDLMMAREDVAVYSFRKETFAEIFGNTGGMVGILMGASVISIVEFVYFYFLVAACVGRHIWRRIDPTKN